MVEETLLKLKPEKHRMVPQGGATKIDSELREAPLFLLMTIGYVEHTCLDLRKMVGCKLIFKNIYLSCAKQYMSCSGMTVKKQLRTRH